MITDSIKYDDSVKDICGEIGCSKVEEETINEYLGGSKISLNDFVYKDFFLLNNTVKENIRKTYLGIEDDSYRKRVFNVLFAIGKQSIFNIIKPYEI